MRTGDIGYNNFHFRGGFLSLTSKTKITPKIANWTMEQIISDFYHGLKIFKFIIEAIQMQSIPQTARFI
jgi:hypothetical protein